MCGCSGGVANKSVASSNRAARFRSITANQACLKPIEYFTAIDYSSWKPEEQSIIKSLLNTYHNKCNSYALTVINIHEFYQGLVQPET